MNRFQFPGSSLKGAMRSSLHRAILEWGEELEKMGYKLTSCGEIDPDFIEKAHQERPCDVCSLFGRPSLGVEGRSKVTVIRDEEQEKKVYKLTRVGIDRKTRVKRNAALFSQEVFKPGEVFSFRVEVSDDPRELSLVLLSLLYLRYWRLGRSGMVDVKVENPCRGQCDELGNKLANRLEEWEVEE